jgi:hypothetical protein
MSQSRKIYQQYRQLQPKLHAAEQLVRDLLSDLPEPEFQLQTNIKPYPRAAEKAKQNKASHISELSDLVRGRVFFSDNFTHQETTDLLKELLSRHMRIIDIDTKRNKDHGLTYQGIVHMDLQFDGINFEMQILPIEFKPFKPLLHKIYEELRSNSKISDARRQFLQDIHNKMYRKINERIKSNRFHL